MHLFSTSPNSRQRPTVLNADVPNCYIRQFLDIKYSTLEIADNKTADVDELKARLIDKWAQFDQSIVDASISQWRRHLGACVYAGYTEHKFWQFWKLTAIKKLIILLNKPHFSLLHMLIKSLESLLQTTQHYVTLWSICV